MQTPCAAALRARVVDLGLRKHVAHSRRARAEAARLGVGLRRGAHAGAGAGVRGRGRRGAAAVQLAQRPPRRGRRGNGRRQRARAVARRRNLLEQELEVAALVADGRALCQQLVVGQTRPVDVELADLGAVQRKARVIIVEDVCAVSASAQGVVRAGDSRSLLSIRSLMAAASLRPLTSTTAKRSLSSVTWIRTRPRALADGSPAA